MRSCIYLNSVIFTDTGQVLKYLRLSKIKFFTRFLLLGSLSNDDGDGNDNNFARALRFFGLTILRNETPEIYGRGRKNAYLPKHSLR